MIDFIYQKNIDAVIYELDKNSLLSTENDSEGLRHSANVGSLELVRIFIKAGADIHARTDEALRNASYGGFVDVVKFLILNGANVCASDFSAFYFAASNGFVGLARLLFNASIEEMSKINSESKLVLGKKIASARDNRVLFAVCENGHVELVRFLIDTKMDIKCGANKALRCAVKKGNLEIVNLLLINGCRPVDGSDYVIDLARNLNLTKIENLLKSYTN